MTLENGDPNPLVATNNIAPGNYLVEVDGATTKLIEVTPNTISSQSANDYRLVDSGITFTLDAGQISALTDANGKDDSLVILNAHITPPGTIVYKTYQKANGEYFQYSTDEYEVFATKAANGDMVPVNYDWRTGISEMSQAELNTSSLPTWPVENSLSFIKHC